MVFSTTKKEYYCGKCANVPSTKLWKLLSKYSVNHDLKAKKSNWYKQKYALPG